MAAFITAIWTAEHAYRNPSVCNRTDTDIPDAICGYEPNPENPYIIRAALRRPSGWRRAVLYRPQSRDTATRARWGEPGKTLITGFPGSRLPRAFAGSCVHPVADTSERIGGSGGTKSNGYFHTYMLTYNEGTAFTRGTFAVSGNNLRL